MELDNEHIDGSILIFLFPARLAGRGRGTARHKIRKTATALRTDKNRIPTLLHLIFDHFPDRHGRSSLSARFSFIISLLNQTVKLYDGGKNDFQDRKSHKIADRDLRPVPSHPFRLPFLQRFHRKTDRQGYLKTGGTSSHPLAAPGSAPLPEIPPSTWSPDISRHIDGIEKLLARERSRLLVEKQLLDELVVAGEFFERIGSVVLDDREVPGA